LKLQRTTSAESNTIIFQRKTWQTSAYRNTMEMICRFYFLLLMQL